MIGYVVYWLVQLLYGVKASPNVTDIAMIFSAVELVFELGGVAGLGLIDLPHYYRKRRVNRK